MASNLARIAHLRPLVDWMETELHLGADTPVDRQEIAKNSGVSIDYVNKSMIALMTRGYIQFNRRRGQPSIHRLLKPLTGVTAEVLHKWISEYQLERDQERRNAQRQQTETEPIPPIEQQTELPLTPSREYQMTEEKPEPLFTPLKSRSQQLLDEAERLRQLAQEEAQREANEAQKGNEQPGTVPELLTMLDSRVDGVEGRFDTLEKKVNTVLYFFQQASYAVRSLAPVGLPEEPVQLVTPQPEPVAEPTTRNLLVRLVNSYAAADRKSEHDTWKWLYGQFDLREGFNVYAQAGPSAKGKDESYLAVIEQHGLIDKLYFLAKKLMKLPELR